MKILYQRKDAVPTSVDDTYEWEFVLEKMAIILKELISELKDLQILKVEHIASGFCDGDLIVVK